MKQLSGLNMFKGWAPEDVWKTVVIPYRASFLVKEVNGLRAKVIALTKLQNRTTVNGGTWKIFDFRVGSWSLREDKCRHSLQSTWRDSNNYAAVDIDLTM